MMSYSTHYVLVIIVRSDDHAILLHVDKQLLPVLLTVMYVLARFRACVGCESITTGRNMYVSLYVCFVFLIPVRGKLKKELKG